jgi:hypothetical protein
VGPWPVKTKKGHACSAGPGGVEPVEEAAPSDVQPWLDVGTPTGALLVATSGLSFRRSLNPSRRSSFTASTRPSLEARSGMRRSSFAERFQRRIAELGEVRVGNPLPLGLPGPFTAATQVGAAEDVPIAWILSDGYLQHSGVIHPQV